MLIRWWLDGKEQPCFWTIWSALGRWTPAIIPANCLKNTKPCWTRIAEKMVISPPTPPVVFWKSPPLPDSSNVLNLAWKIRSTATCVIYATTSVSLAIQFLFFIFLTISFLDICSADAYGVTKQDARNDAYLEFACRLFQMGIIPNLYGEWHPQQGNPAQQWELLSPSHSLFFAFFSALTQAALKFHSRWVY